MAVLDVQNLSISYGEKTLFDSLSLQINENTRAALVGENGCGKSTLLKVITGEMPSDSDRAKVMLSAGSTLLYLEQKNALLERGKTLSEVLSSIKPLKKDIPEHEHKKNINIVVQGLNFKQSDMSKKISEFSPGFQMRIALAILLASKPTFMLLDEPTNYLDIEGRVFLAKYLNSLTGGYILVSHDKEFIDKSCNVVYELSKGVLKRYRGNYSSYITQKKEKGEIKPISQIHINPGQGIFSPNDIITLTGICKSYGENKVLENLDLYVQKGDRLAIIGQNGKGKSTLMRIIAGVDKPDSGYVKTHSSLVAEYFSQERDLDYTSDKTIIDELRTFATTSDEPRLRDILGSFGFSGDDIFKSVNVLSGGEQSRLALLIMLLHPSNLLLLDEVTNHLDIPTKEILLSALEDYKGSIIFVSHDIDFVRRLATCILYYGENGIKYYNGNWDYFVRRRADEDNSNNQNIQTKTTTKSSGAEKKQNTSDNDLQNSKQKRNKITSLERKITELELKITELDRTKTDFESKLNLPEIYSNTVACKEVTDNLNNTISTINETQDELLSLMLELDELKNQD